MVKKILLAGLICLPALAASAQDNGYDNDFGTWWEVGAKKEFNKKWSVGLDAELRLQDNSAAVDRIGVGVSGSYKVNKYLKLGAGYALLEGYKPEKSKIKNGDTDQNNVVLDYRERITPGYWNSRHRFYFEVSPDIKFGKAWHLSLRERYQYTFTPLQHHSRDNYYYEWNGDGYDLDRSNKEVITDEKDNRHVLRSRIKLEYDRKKLDWKPFVSIEAQNNLCEQMHLRKLRGAVGTEYKINRHHSVGAAYVVTRANEHGDKDIFHALNFSYNYKF